MEERNLRKTRVGKVVSNKMDKTIVVAIEDHVQHPLYKKIVKKTEGNCARCGSKMLIKKSKNGKSFYGCEKYPECNFMTWDEPIGDVCPKCGATLFRKKGKAGKLYCAKEGCGFERGLKG